MSDFQRQEPIGLEKPKSLLFFDESKVKRDKGKFAKKEGAGAEEKPESSRKGGKKEGKPETPREGYEGLDDRQAEAAENIFTSYEIAIEDGEMSLDDALDAMSNELVAEGLDPDDAERLMEAWHKENFPEGGCG